MTKKRKKGRQFFEGKNRVTPSAAALGDSNLSDATKYIETFKMIKTDVELVNSLHNYSCYYYYY